MSKVGTSQPIPYILMSIAAKVYNRILLNRIRPVADPVLRWNQAGFGKGKRLMCRLNPHPN